MIRTAKHDYTGVTGTITVNGTTTWIKGDFSLDKIVGRYNTCGSKVGKHTLGPKKVSGTITHAWGDGTAEMFTLFDGDTEFDVVFDPLPDGSEEAITCSGCLFTNFKSGMEADSEGALEVDGPFVGLDWSRA